MEDITSGGDGNGGGDGSDRPSGEVEAPRARIDDQMTEGASASHSAKYSSIDSGNGGHAQGVGDDGDQRTLVGSETGGPRVSRLDFRSGVEASWSPVWVLVGPAVVAMAPVTSDRGLRRRILQGGKGW